MNKYKCNTCSWVYYESKGDVDGGIKPGTKFEDIPDDWKCPVCGVSKDQFSIIKKLDGSTETTSGDSNSGISYLGEFEKLDDDVESELRTIYTKAVTGKKEIAAMRTKKFANLFEDIMFVPGQLATKPLREDEAEINLNTTIGPRAKKPLEINLPYFVSHISFGSISKEAKTALAKGSSSVKTLICSGEGGMLPEERENAYKYIFEYSTGRFGVSDEIMKKADAIEIKIGQAAKAGMGGHLLGNKVTEEIAKVRNVEPGKTIISPANHTDINSKEDLKKKIDW